MLEEIRQQPETLERTLQGELRRIEKFRELVSRRKPRLIVLAARGTSDNAAQFARYLIEITTGIPVSLAAPSISTLYQAKIDYRETMVIAISQSGESTDTNVVLEMAQQTGRHHRRHHQRITQRARRLGRTRLPGARRQREERRRHQDLHRPDC